MPAHKKRFCINGHDTDIVGRYPDSRCRECARERLRLRNADPAYKEKQRAYQRTPRYRSYANEKKRTPEYRARANQRIRERRLADPKFRERERQRVNDFRKTPWGALQEQLRGMTRIRTDY